MSDYKKMRSRIIKQDQHFPRSRGDARSDNDDHQSPRILCPTCDGSGYLERPKQQTKIDLNAVTSKLKKVPRIANRTINDGCRLEAECSPISMSVTSERSDSVSPSRNSYTKRQNTSPSRYLSRNCEARGRSESPTSITKQIKAKFKDMNDECSLIEGLNLVILLAKDNSSAAKEHMSTATRGLCNLLRSHKANSIRKACSILTELFQMINLVFRPEFDDLVALLMVKTGDLNQKVRAEATDALMVLATFAPANHLVRAVFAKGPNSKSPTVRLAAIQALNRVVSEVSLTNLFVSGSMRDSRKKIIQSGCALLKDQSSEVRKVAKSMMLKLMQHEEFDDVLYQELDHEEFKKVEKSIICIKYGENKSV